MKVLNRLLDGSEGQAHLVEMGEDEPLLPRYGKPGHSRSDRPRHPRPRPGRRSQHQLRSGTRTHLTNGSPIEDVALDAIELQLRNAHSAALAIKHQAELHSTDADMASFPGLKWVNPLI